MKAIWILLILSATLLGQTKFAGNVSLETAYTDYNTESAIWTENAFRDSILSRNLSISQFDLADYSSSYLVPGLEEKLSTSLFYFAQNYKLAFYMRVRNNDWIQPNELRYIDRLSLTATFGNQKITFGDNFVNSSMHFMNNRRIRGGTGEFNFYESDDLNVGMTVFSGLVDYRHDVGDPVIGRYRSYYAVNRYERNMTGAILNMNVLNKRFEFTAGYLTGEDAVTDTIGVLPFKNTVVGGGGKFNIYEKQVFIYGDYYQAVTDTIAETSLSSGNPQTSYTIGVGIDNSIVLMDLSGYYIDETYYSFGHPYLIRDREGIIGRGRIKFSDKLNVNAKVDLYDTNVNDRADALKLSSRELEFKLNIPFNEIFSITGTYFRLSDISKDIIGVGPSIENESAQIFRISNTFEINLAYNLPDGQFSIYGGYNSTDDQGIYGYSYDVETDTDEPIFGISSNRTYLGFGGFYNFNQDVIINTSISHNIISQVDIDQTMITNIQFSATYNVLPGELRLNAVGNFVFNDNELASSSYFRSLAESAQTRYRLFSAINRFTHNFLEVGAEYLFTYNLRAKLTMRLDDKQYGYLDDQLFTIESIRTEMLNVSNPIFFNQKESYTALVFNVGFSYLL